ncbi:MAG: glycoside hydrolase family 2 protein [Ruminococcaceae bacterium]|nr:glycoside hydrolase family 2 protein [Oscillospiraceae bacterium]
MKKICISKGWDLEAPNFKGKVDLPNDYTVTLPRSANAAGGASNGYFQGGNGTYVKYVNIDKTPRHYILDIDGAYMCATVKCNGYQMVMHPHGYAPILVDLTKRLKFGEDNQLVVITEGLQCSTRWYSGAGVYRDVFLWEGGDVRLEPWDVFVTTPTLDTVNAAYEIAADRDASVMLTAQIFDGDALVASAETAVSVKSGEKTAASLTFTVNDAKTWDTEHPNLYTIRTTLTENGAELDADERIFGIRTISADAKNGLLLNGKLIKLRGGCIHHDHGVLGAADFPAACRRKLTRLKNAGFNALRIAHNPPSEQLLEMCDELGIIVMDEAFDCWRQNKGGQFNYHKWFDGWWDKDIAAMVKRDRSHPSVISYSIGNEIPESYGATDGDEWSERLAAEIRKYDDTRLVTSATYQMGDGATWAKRTEGYWKPLDICGYNYLYPRYESDHELYPDRVIWGSETHAIDFYDSWNKVLRYPYVLGDFTWTAYDNLGEAGTGRALWARDGVIKGISCAPYPYRTCYQGDLDLCGYRRPQSYFREAVWIGGCEPRIFTTHPEHYGEGFTGTHWHWYDVLDSWTFEDKYIGKPVKCEVYTDADEIAWFVNGRAVGTSKPEKAIAYMDIPYEPGEISVIAYKNGAECGRSSLHTTGAPARVIVTPETDTLAADNRDLCYFDITIADEAGVRTAAARNAISCIVDGGELLGIFSGDPCNEDQYGSNACHAFEGRAVAIVRTNKPGCVTITVGGPDLQSGSASVTAQ